MLAIVNTPICPIKSDPGEWEKSPTLSHLTDEILMGMPLEITGDEHHRWVPVRTFYGYSGWAPLKDLVLGELAEKWQKLPKKIVLNKLFADVLARPNVKARIVAKNLPMGACLAVQEDRQDGWQSVILPDGRSGFVPNSILEPLYTSPCTKDPAALRKKVTDTARRYRFAPYRWGGKTPGGIDCSGLCSMAYLICGIIIWRDASIQEGFPIKPIPISRMDEGDLIFFPGHVAMYMGDGLYIHSTARAGDNGVTINSLYPRSHLYREDLAGMITAVGSYF